MATKLTKKQQSELTEKLTGVIQKNNALQLRLSADRSVNEMNVNQISGALNRIHVQAIGKDIPTAVTIPVNVSGYNIDGIGTVYGGTLNIDTGELISTMGHMVIERRLIVSVAESSTGVKYANVTSIFTAVAGSLNTYLDGYTPTDGTPATGGYIRSQRFRYFIYDNRFETVQDAYNILVGLSIVAELETPETYTLTPQQMLQLLDQL